MSTKPDVELDLHHQRINSGLVHGCLTLYPTVLERVYKTLRPKLDLREILADDGWRYQELPAALSGSKGAGDGLSKDQLARLVKWKITHGTYRPFLPGMIQKNSEDEVRSSTRKASKLVVAGTLLAQDSAEAITKQIEAALTEVCVLKGVGPATGTLVLSAFNPVLVPFFEDELFRWLVPGHTAKLKYDRKEYKAMLGKALEVVLSMHGVEARDLEKVAYVAEHLDVLGEDEKKFLVLSGKGAQATASDVSMEDPPAARDSEEQDALADDVPKRRAKRSQPQELDDLAQNAPSVRRSKRTRK